MNQLKTERTLALIPLSHEQASQDGLRLTIQGRTVLEWTVDAMRRVSEISDIVIAQPAPNRLVTLRQALDSAPASERVLFHEPNRPLTSAAGLRSFLRDASAHQAAAMVAPVKSTYKEVVDARVVGTMPRNQLFQLQHVLVVDRAPFEDALGGALREGKLDGDELTLCQRAGMPIQLIPGSFFNFPVAARADAEFVEMALLHGLRLAP
ncbi:MAG: 2-C-methyl-D-erythritol 4-phosphate cytidylyltransferase [Candidatus Dormibacteraeota bacterium]|nr:2-C-methyl-D-erythritol 4-phosphate cytidylyltransferase [Candidatus Dormibacteraeota bacterium]